MQVETASISQLLDLEGGWSHMAGQDHTPSQEHNAPSAWVFLREDSGKPGQEESVLKPSANGISGGLENMLELAAKNQK